MLLGYSVAVAEETPASKRARFPIVFGDFARGYLIADGAGLKFLRDPYTRKPHVLLWAYKRVGGYTSNTDAMPVMNIGGS